jgi:hypothetical protein
MGRAVQYSSKLKAFDSIEMAEFAAAECGEIIGYFDKQQ